MSTSGYAISASQANERSRATFHRFQTHSGPEPPVSTFRRTDCSERLSPRNPLCDQLIGTGLRGARTAACLEARYTVIWLSDRKGTYPPVDRERTGGRVVPAH